MPGVQFYGRRRRRVITLATSVVTSATTADQTASVIVVPQVRQPRRETVRLPISLRSIYTAGGFPPPPPGPSNKPPPLLYIHAVQRRVGNPVPIILSTQRDYAFNWGANVRKPVASARQPARPTQRPIKPGQNFINPGWGVFSRPIIAAKKQPARPTQRPIVPGQQKPPSLDIGLHQFSIAQAPRRLRRPTSRPIIPGQNVVNPGQGLATKYIVAAKRQPARPLSRPIIPGRNLTLNQFAPMPQITVVSVAAFKRYQQRSTFPIVSHSATQAGQVVAFDPVVVNVVRRRLPVRMPISHQPWKFNNATVEHNPLPVITVVHIVRRPPVMRPSPVALSSNYASIAVNNAGNPDLIAACIAWMRADSATVTAFGDNFAAGIDKFTSDVEPPGIDPPYAVFHEPQEVESYESKDSTGLRSSLASGEFIIEVFATGKLQARQMAENLVTLLNDAPLVFDDGVLVYLKRTIRRFPTLKEPGTGTNIVMFKRAIEFEYKIERNIPG